MFGRRMISFEVCCRRALMPENFATKIVSGPIA